MLPTSIVELSSVAGQPKAKLALPVPLRQGDKLRLAFVLRRQNGGRHEVLTVQGEYRVVTVSQSTDHQFLSVEATGIEPAWKAVRRPASQLERKLPPTVFPRTVVR